MSELAAPSPEAMAAHAPSKARGRPAHDGSPDHAHDQHTKSAAPTVSKMAVHAPAQGKGKPAHDKPSDRVIPRPYERVHKHSVDQKECKTDKNMKMENDWNL